MLWNWREPTILCHFCICCLRIVTISFCPSGFRAAPTLWVLCQNWTGGWRIAPTPHMGRRLGCFSGSARTPCTYVYLIHLYLPNQRGQQQKQSKGQQQKQSKPSQMLQLWSIRACTLQSKIIGVEVQFVRGRVDKDHSLHLGLSAPEIKNPTAGLTWGWYSWELPRCEDSIGPIETQGPGTRVPSGL